ncbi:MAG: hypothetical protein ACKVOB_06585 [Sphingomonas sp.]
MKYRVALILVSLCAPAIAAQKPVTPVPLPVSVDGLPIGAIPRQQLPPGGCAAFLWAKTPSGALVAMVTASPGQLRFAPYGTLTDLVRTSQSGGGLLGFAATSSYAGGDLRVTIDMDVALRDDLKDGAVVQQGTLRFERDGQDAVIVPVAGLVGCG